jgi:hypothetical protein
LALAGWSALTMRRRPGARQRGRGSRLTAAGKGANRPETNRDRIGDLVRFGICSPQDIVSLRVLTTIPNCCSPPWPGRCWGQGDAP